MVFWQQKVILETVKKKKKENSVWRSLVLPK